MAPFKKHLASPHHPKNTQINVHKGKGSAEYPLRGGTSMNDYSKATPMAMPSVPTPSAPAPMGNDNDADDFPT